jgi:hypothetical protein
VKEVEDAAKAWGEQYQEDWLKLFRVVDTWQVVLDMPSREEALRLAKYHMDQRDGQAAVQVMRRYVPREGGE